MILFPGDLTGFSYFCCSTNKTWRRALPGTYHVHETVFSTLARDIVSLPLPVVNTTALSLFDMTLMHLCAELESLSECV